MSALDDALRALENEEGYPRTVKAARAELAALRADVARLTAERDAARRGHDYAVEEQKKSTEYITDLLTPSHAMSGAASASR